MYTYIHTFRSIIPMFRISITLYLLLWMLFHIYIFIIII